MSSIDAPDWQRVVTTVSAAGDVPDAPDWERIVVGPTGTPVGGGGASDWVPQDYGMSGWTSNFFGMWANADFNPTTARVYYSLIRCAVSTTVEYMVYNNVAPHSTPTAHENFLGLYTNGVVGGVQGAPQLLGTTAVGGMDSSILTAGFWAIPLVTGVAVTAGTLYYGALLVNGSSDPCAVGYIQTGYNWEFQSSQITHNYLLQFQTGSNTSLPSSLTTPSNTNTQSEGVWLAMI